jgi:hypothetical protein
MLDKDKNPIPCDSSEAGQLFNEADQRRVAATNVGKMWVSTVFLGLDHSWDPEGPPILFETMIFNGPWNEWQERYATWDEAVAGHEEAVRIAKRARFNVFAYLRKWWRGY